MNFLMELFFLISTGLFLVSLWIILVMPAFSKSQFSQDLKQLIEKNDNGA